MTAFAAFLAFNDSEGWTEISRKAVGLHASGLCRGPGWSNDGYYHAVYEVKLTKCIDGNHVFKTVVETGPAIHFYGEGYHAFIDLYKTYMGRATNPGKLADGEQSHGMSARWQVEVAVPTMKASKKALDRFRKRHDAETMRMANPKPKRKSK